VRVSTVPAAATSSTPTVAGTGTDYLLDRRQHQRRLAEDAKAVALAAGELDAELAALAERTRERVYRADTVVARSYLVPDAARGELVRVLASISDRLRDAGCAVEVVGPLPPYSFTDVRLEVVP
jgi:hypothetical protein